MHLYSVTLLPGWAGDETSRDQRERAYLSNLCLTKAFVLISIPKILNMRGNIMIKKLLFVAVWLFNFQTVFAAFCRVPTAVVELNYVENGVKVIRRLDPPMSDEQYRNRYLELRAACETTLDLILELDQERRSEYFAKVESLRSCGTFMGHLKSTLIPNYFQIMGNAIIDGNRIDQQNFDERYPYVKKYVELLMSLSIDIKSFMSQLRQDEPDRAFLSERVLPKLDQQLMVLNLEMLPCVLHQMTTKPNEFARELQMELVNEKIRESERNIDELNKLMSDI
jgi:hypothetical protein